MFTPKLDILPAAQLTLWPELVATPEEFTLYGGTAIALRLGHRSSVDFDFFSTQPFAPEALMSSVPYLAGGTVRQMAPNTLTATVDRGGAVLLSFFGRLGLGQVAPAERASGPRFATASLLDLSGFKAAVIYQRAELKDYLDIHALLTKGDIPLAVMLAAAGVIYGREFNPLVSLKAISYHDDPALAGLSPGIRRDLIAAVRQVNVTSLPVLDPVRHRAPIA